MAGSSSRGTANLTKPPTLKPSHRVPDGAGVIIEVRAQLDGSYEPAQAAFAELVQSYANRLAGESARQEASGRVPGVITCEITESAVRRAVEALDQAIAKRQRPATRKEGAALALSPTFASAASVTGGYLHSPGQWAVFAGMSVLALLCIFYQLKRRLL